MSKRMPRRFTKMHGAGNDFVLIDLRGGQPAPDAAQIRQLGDRRTGIGFDQLIAIEDSHREGCVARYRIWNGDGSPAVQCGNGARCVAAWLLRDGAANSPRFRLDSPAGVVEARWLDSGEYAIDMGRPDFTPAHIPFQAPAEAGEYTLATAAGELRFGAVSLGNPHAVLLVDDVAAAPVAELGAIVQARHEFPQGVNVGFAEVVSPAHVRLRVFERGVGETRACGSGACAAAAVLIRQGRVERQVAVDLPGGRLQIDWPSDDAGLRMAGPAAFVFEGEIPDGAFSA